MKLVDDVYWLIVWHQVVDGDAGQLDDWYKPWCLFVYIAGSRLAAPGCRPWWSDPHAGATVDSPAASRLCKVFVINTNNNNKQDDIYSAVIMTTRSLQEFSQFIWSNVEQHQAATDPQTKPPDLGCESACRLLSTTTIDIYYYYSARKLILVEGRRLSWPRHCRKGAHSLCPRLHDGSISQCTICICIYLSRFCMSV